MTNNELRNMDRNELNKALAEAWHQVEIATHRLNDANADLDEHPDDPVAEANFVSALKRREQAEQRHEFLLNENNRRMWG